MKVTTNKALETLRWNSFEQYPQQGSDIMLHAAGISTETEQMVHRFIKVGNFNAVSFNIDEIIKRLMAHVNWKFSWLPMREIERQDNVDESSATNKQH